MMNAEQQIKTPCGLNIKPNGFAEITDSTGKVIAFWSACVHRPERIPQQAALATEVLNAINAHADLVSVAKEHAKMLTEIGGTRSLTESEWLSLRRAEYAIGGSL